MTFKEKEIYLVQRNDNNLGYDEYHNFVVCAESPKGARQICARMSADEGVEIWNSKQTTVKKLNPMRLRKGVVLSDFNAG